MSTSYDSSMVLVKTKSGKQILVKAEESEWIEAFRASIARRINMEIELPDKAFYMLDPFDVDSFKPLPNAVVAQ